MKSKNDNQRMLTATQQFFIIDRQVRQVPNNIAFGLFGLLSAYSLWFFSKS